MLLGYVDYDRSFSKGFEKEMLFWIDRKYLDLSVEGAPRIVVPYNGKYVDLPNLLMYVEEIDERNHRCLVAMFHLTFYKTCSKKVTDSTDVRPFISTLLDGQESYYFFYVCQGWLFLEMFDCHDKNDLNDIQLAWVNCGV